MHGKSNTTGWTISDRSATRRGFLGGAMTLPAVLASGASVALPSLSLSSDAELLALFEEWDRALAHANEPGDWPDEETNARCDAVREIEDRIAELRPTTREGAFASLAFFQRYAREWRLFRYYPEDAFAANLLGGSVELIKGGA